MLITIFLHLFIVCILHSSVAENVCTVAVQQGTLAGKVVETVTGDSQYCSFQGIPYAQPPVGDLRFKAPVAASEWYGVRDATKHGAVCPQVDFLKREYIPGDEDCLFLNVYTRNVNNLSSILLPVIFFIHGGGFKSGSGNVDSFGPDFFLRGNDLVIVTMNYRLDALGFLCLDTEEVPGNAGLKDQVMALQWVQTNIEQFGGDPNKVTIMGQSAGGCSVAMHIASPMSTGLFHRAISMSGSPYNEWALSFEPNLRAHNLGKKLDCETGNTDTLLSCLRNVTSEQLVNYSAPNVLQSETITATMPAKLAQFTPVAEKNCDENSFLCEDLLDGKFTYVNNVDLMFGYTSHEGLVVAPDIADSIENFKSFIETFASKKVCYNLPPFKCLNMGFQVRDYYLGNKSISNSTFKELVNYVSDSSFKYDILRYYSMLPNNGSKYMYQFSSQTNRNYYGLQYSKTYGVCDPGPCAAHIDDLFSLFDPKSLNLTLSEDSKEMEVIDLFTTVIKNFIYYGNPAPEDSCLNVTWPEFDSTSMQYMDIATPEMTLSTVGPFYNFWLNSFISAGINL